MPLTCVYGSLSTLNNIVILLLISWAVERISPDLYEMVIVLYYLPPSFRLSFFPPTFFFPFPHSLFHPTVQAPVPPNSMQGVPAMPPLPSMPPFQPPASMGLVPSQATGAPLPNIPPATFPSQSMPEHIRPNVHPHSGPLPVPHSLSGPPPFSAALPFPPPVIPASLQLAPAVGPYPSFPLPIPGTTLPPSANTPLPSPFLAPPPPATLAIVGAPGNFAPSTPGSNLVPQSHAPLGVQAPGSTLPGALPSASQQHQQPYQYPAQQALSHHGALPLAVPPPSNPPAPLPPISTLANSQIPTATPPTPPNRSSSASSLPPPSFPPAQLPSAPPLGQASSQFSAPTIPPTMPGTPSSAQAIPAAQPLDLTALAAELPGTRKRRVYATSVVPPPLAPPSYAQQQAMEEGMPPAIPPAVPPSLGSTDFSATPPTGLYYQPPLGTTGEVHRPTPAPMAGNYVTSPTVPIATEPPSPMVAPGAVQVCMHVCVGIR